MGYLSSETKVHVLEVRKTSKMNCNRMCVDVSHHIEENKQEFLFGIKIYCMDLLICVYRTPM